MTQISWQLVIIGALLAICVPMTLRALMSPITLVLLAPIAVVFLMLMLVGSNIAMALIIQRFYPAVKEPARLRRATRPLLFSTPAAWQAVTIRSRWSGFAAPRQPLVQSSEELSESLEDILLMMIRDFVMVWYSKISASPTFPSSLNDTIHSALTVILSRLELLDLPSLVVHRILPKVTAHVERFRQSEMGLRGVGIERHLTQTEELDILLASRYAGKDGKLHPAVENLASPMTKHTEQAHLRELVAKILPVVMPEKDAASNSVLIVAREIVACVVLSQVLEMLSDPDFWNRAIDEAAGAVIRQQKLVHKVRGILEAQSSGSSQRSHGSAVPMPVGKIENITSRTAVRQFESFIQSINQCNSLLDARRLKNDVAGEIRRTRVLLANHENEETINGEKASDVVAYLDRLYNAKRHVEARINLLGGADDISSRHSILHESTSQRVTLRDILSNPNSLSYFMEFMDRKDKSLAVQFWVTVETFKNPLEEVGSDSEDSEPDDEDTLAMPALPSASATIRSDLTMIDELYFSNPKSLARLPGISERNIEAVRTYLHDSQPSTSALTERRARRCVLHAQREIERAMEDDFQEFENSELWFKALNDLRVSSGDKFVMRQASSSSDERHSETPLVQSIMQPPPLGRSRTGERPMLIIPPKPSRAETEPLNNSHSIASLVSPNTVDHSSRGSYDVALPPKTPPGPSLAFLISSGPEAARVPLFEDEEGDQEDPPVQQETIEALQAALTDLIANETEVAPDSRRQSTISSIRPNLMSNSSSTTDVLDMLVRGDRGAKRSSRLFDDDDERQSVDDAASDTQFAAPGDLHLTQEIQRLGEKIDALQAQENILDALTRKAELTGDEQELKLLRRSRDSLEKDIREFSFQRSQYEQQESDNRLIPERTRISIASSALTEETTGKQVVRYLVQVQQLAPDGSFASGWVVARRYNEFWNMHQQLRDKLAVARGLDFPPKKLVTSLSSSFVDTRRAGLEKYMQTLVKIPLACESEELRSFLSRTVDAPSPSQMRTSTSLAGLIPGQGIVRNMYRSVAGSIDDMFFGPSMLDVMIQRLNKQAAEFAGIVGSGVQDEDLIEQALKAKSRSQAKDGNRFVPPEETLLKISSSGDLKTLEGESGMSSFTAPICDLILAVFELDEKNHWLRKHAIVIILQQVLGGTIERKVKDMAREYLDHSHLLSYLAAFKNILWPGGALKPPTEPRTFEEKIRTRDEANRKLSTLMPDLAANMIGRSNARRGARRMFSVLQNRRLNQHLVYSVLDEVLAAIFPEAGIR